jgi:hypothetical protein
VYVDFTPIRGKLTITPETSNYNNASNEFTQL